MTRESSCKARLCLLSWIRQLTESGTWTQHRKITCLQEPAHLPEASLKTSHWSSHAAIHSVSPCHSSNGRSLTSFFKVWNFCRVLKLMAPIRSLFQESGKVTRQFMDKMEEQKYRNNSSGKRVVFLSSWVYTAELHNKHKCDTNWIEFKRIYI